MLEKILPEIKICDNSCGSGAFLIACANVLFKIYKKMNEKINRFTDIELRKKILENNIYGVDINSKAVEIAKLRLWLWLVEVYKEDNIEPLTNIEYNIKCGNSLIGYTRIKKFYDGRSSHFISEYNENSLKNSLIENSEQKKIYKKSSGEKSKKLKKEIDEKDRDIKSRLTEYFFKENSIGETIPKTKPFHWEFEFYEVFENGGFDVIVGNPPYGNLLSMEEKKLLSKVEKAYSGEIASQFIQKSISLLKENGYFGNIITYAITFSKKLSCNRKDIYKNFESCYISSFDRDKCRIFNGVTQSVSIILCNNKKEKSKANFFTSKLYREFNIDNQNLDEIKYQKSNDYLLSEENADFCHSHRLPKIGEKLSKEILDKLLAKQNNLKNLFETKPLNDHVWIRTSGNYWYNAFDKKPYESENMKKFLINKSMKDYVIVLINSNLFYFWFRKFGNGRNMDIDILKLMPCPETKEIKENQKSLEKNSQKILKHLFENFDGKHNKFNTSKIKKYVDECDHTLNKFYNLTKKELEYILDYDKEVRGGRKL